MRTSGWLGLVAALCALACQPANDPVAAKDADILQQAGLPADGPALLNYFRQRTTDPPTRERVTGLLRRLDADSFAARQQAVDDLIKIGPAAVGQLRHAVAHSSAEVSRLARRALLQLEPNAGAHVTRAAARTLAATKTPGVVAALLSYLPEADDATTADAIAVAVATSARSADPAELNLRTYLRDPSAARRAAAAEALAGTRRPDAVAAAREFAADADPIVRLRTLLALVWAARERESVPALIELLAVLPQQQAWRAEDLLMRLAGDSAPDVPPGKTPAEREQCRDAWKAWWASRGATADLDRLGTDPPLAGCTLVLEFDPGATADGRGVEFGGSGAVRSGRVIEYGPDGRIRWALRDVAYPQDVQYLGPERVLLLEGSRQALAGERDPGGRLLAKFSAIVPTNAQRLPNGFTLLVSRNRVTLLNAVGMEPRMHNRVGNDIVTATARPDRLAIITRAGDCLLYDTSAAGAEFQEIKSVKLGRVSPLGEAHFLPNDRLLVTLEDGVADFDLDGKQLAKIVCAKPSSVQRLSNGRTLVAHEADEKTGRTRVAEFDKAGRVVWEYTPDDGGRPWRARRR